MKNTQRLYLAMLVVFCIFLAGCAPQATALDGPTKEAILAYTEAKTDTLVEGLISGDYATFSQDFDADMLKAIGETEFEKLKTERDAKFGAYVSREIDSVLQQGDFYAVIYKTKFEKDADVKMRVVFRIKEPHEISGLWFNK